MTPRSEEPKHRSEKIFFMDWMWEVRLREDSRMTPRHLVSAIERRELTLTKNV